MLDDYDQILTVFRSFSSALGKKKKNDAVDDKKNFVPYRDSKLTKLLMDSLGKVVWLVWLLGLLGLFGLL